MKQLIPLLLTTIFLFGCGNNKPESGDKTPVVTNLSATAFKALIDTGSGIILDVRTPQEIAQGKIGNATNIDFNAPDFETQIKQLDKNQEIYLYCRSGARSSQAAAILQKNGFDKIYQLKNGILEWEKQGFVVE